MVKWWFKWQKTLDFWFLSEFRVVRFLKIQINQKLS